MTRIPRGLKGSSGVPVAKGLTGGKADLEDYLIGSGYRYDSSMADRDDELTWRNDRGNTIKMRRIAHGRPAQRINVPLSENMTMTRLHATPDTWQIVADESHGGTEMSSVQTTIIEQLKTQNPDFVSHWSVQAIMGINEDGKEGIQVSTKQRGYWVNYQILYNPNLDVYDVKAFRVDSRTADVQEVYSSEGIYWDNLYSAMQSGDQAARVGVKVQSRNRVRH